jgi:hypothetical protein
MLLCVAAFACETDEDCNLNGLCVSEGRVGERTPLMRCVCDAWWAGDACSALKFQPSKAKNKFAFEEGHGANGSSWGGSIAKGDDGTFHLFASEWINECGLAYWTPNSRIVRATSSSASGPYMIAAEVLPTFWTNPQLVRAMDKNRTWLLFTDGIDCNRTVDCRNTSKPPPSRLPTCTPHKHMENGISLFSSLRLAGPWTSHGRILNGTARPAGGGAAPWDYDTTNPGQSHTLPPERQSHIPSSLYVLLVAHTFFVVCRTYLLRCMCPSAACPVEWYCAPRVPRL